MNYSKLIGLVATHLMKTTCTYCGAETFARSEHSACNFCELMPSDDTADKILLPSSETISKMQEIHALIKSGDIDSAAAKTEQMANISTNPYVLYIAGRLYLRMSDIAYHGVNYNLKGFMEANAETREKGLRLEAKAREYFYKAIFAIDTMHDVKSNTLLYVKFIALMRLGRYADAEKVLHALSENTSASRYSAMVYETFTNSKNAIERIKANIPKELNAFYYLAKYLAKNGKSNDAQTLLEKVMKIAELDMAFDLTEKIKQLKSETE
ncbi:MAG: hypothetical protein QW091_00435 [Candidatus Micrarchaeaceae archaeon]